MLFSYMLNEAYIPAFLIAIVRDSLMAVSRSLAMAMERCAPIRPAGFLPSSSRASFYWRVRRPMALHPGYGPRRTRSPRAAARRPGSGPQSRWEDGAPVDFVLLHHGKGYRNLCGSAQVNGLQPRSGHGARERKIPVFSIDHRGTYFHVQGIRWSIDIQVNALQG